MRTIKIVLLSLVIVSPAVCQQTTKVDLDGPAIRTEPKAMSGRIMGGDNGHQSPTWRVDLSVSAADTAGSVVLEIHIVNVSATLRVLPISEDGMKHVAECPNHQLLTATIFLASKEREKYYRKLGYFFGCEARPTTLVQIQPGEWVCYVTKLKMDRFPKEMRTEISLVHKSYRPSADGQTVENEDTEWATFEASPWVLVPGKPATNK